VLFDLILLCCLLIYIISFLIKLCASLVIIVKNPVHSVLFLVLVFVETSLLLFAIEIEFLPLIFIVIYVGAIAVLFLFVVMMIDIKLVSSVENMVFLKYFSIENFILLIFFLNYYIVLIKVNFMLWIHFLHLIGS